MYPPSLIPAADPSQPQLAELARRMGRFYNSSAADTDYEAFQSSIDRTPLYSELDRLLFEQTPRRERPLRVLEVGAGRSGYPCYLRQHGSRVEYLAQDVAASNMEHFRQAGVELHAGDLKDLQGEFDLVLSTYVLEHVVQPQSFLHQVDRLLRRGGHHVIICPRYGLPGYVCPSLRHLPRVAQLRHSVMLALSRLQTMLSRKERFWINTDPAVFHGSKWFRDSDAVHLVGRGDVVRWHRRHGFEVRSLPKRVHGAAGSWRMRLLRQWLALAIACRKLGAPEGIPAQ